MNKITRKLLCGECLVKVRKAEAEAMREYNKKRSDEIKWLREKVGNQRSQ